MDASVDEGTAAHSLGIASPIALFDVATARRHLLDKDPQAQFALGLFGEAESLLKAPAAAATRVASK